MEGKNLSKDAKKRIKANIDREIDRRQAIYEQLPEEDKKALRLGREMIFKEEHSKTFGS